MWEVKEYKRDLVGYAEFGSDWAKSMSAGIGVNLYTNTKPKLDTARTRNTYNYNSPKSGAGGSSGTIVILVLLLIGGGVYAGISPSTKIQKSKEATVNKFEDDKSSNEAIEKISSVDIEIKQIQLNVHNCPSLSCKTLIQVKRGDHVTATENSGDGFYKIQYGDVIGYARLLATR